MQLLVLVRIKYGPLSVYHTQLQHRLYNILQGCSVQVVTLRNDVFSSILFQHGWRYRSELKKRIILACIIKNSENICTADFKVYIISRRL